MIGRSKNMFAPEEINTGRQYEMDIAKAMAIIFMVLCHTLEMLSDWTNELLILILDDVLGGPFAAPVFMFCMGMGIRYSRKNTPQDLFKRGVKLLVIGAVLNIFRHLIPLLIALFMQAVSLKELIYRVVGVDILQFAGLAFISLSLLLYFNVKPGWIAGIALAASLLGSLLRNVSTGHFLTNLLCAFFWRSDWNSYFPLLNWFIFPVGGYLFGGLWRHCKDKKAFYRLVTPVCCVISAVYLFYSYPTGDIYTAHLYYGVSTIHALFFFAVIMATLGISYFMTALPERIVKPLYWMSYHVNSIYCIHWVILGFAERLILVALLPICPDRFIIPMGIAILIVSCLLLEIYLKIRKASCRDSR